MSFGYLINKSGSQRALDYLTTTLNPRRQARTEGPPAAAGPFAATTAEQDEDLGKICSHKVWPCRGAARSPRR